MVIATVAEPAIAEGELGARTTGRLIGTGTERSAAAVLGAVGLALVALGLWIARSWINPVLDAEPAGTSANQPMTPNGSRPSETATWPERAGRSA